MRRGDMAFHVHWSPRWAGRRAVADGQLDADTLAALDVSTDPRHGWKAWLAARYKERWIVYATVPLAGAEQVIRYLGQYTHRVAIANSRIRAIDRVAGTVQIQTRRGPRTLRGEDFVKRFVRHILPSGFRKIRHYGLLAPGNVATRLPLARALLGGEPPAAVEPDLDAIVAEAVAVLEGAAPSAWEVLASALLGRDLRQCPCCGAMAVRRLPLPTARGPP